jgi:hypothetical protein
VKALLLFVLVLVLVGGGLKMAGVRLPLIDYPIGPVGEGQGPGMPDVQIEAPGFEDAQTLP